MDFISKLYIYFETVYFQWRKRQKTLNNNSCQNIIIFIILRVLYNTKNTKDQKYVKIYIKVSFIKIVKL